MSATQQNNFLSIGTGVIGGLGKYLTDGGSVEILKVIAFAFIGGVFGYLGNLFIKKIHNFLRNL